ncbi:uncharacterized protein PV09_06160 [Verruconis gallopava]|uniref:Uncharacterized protein n=1 Tax=Verruconis gallopava TaxID=253628 RepID=A0A0D1XK63_9PEZI|nr:uncharacterized protein PV09_06160 [Verruconis gallopava]KIW02726.1 hypothetical protein PV09_06160 [Verruconis gallopava]
MASLASSHRALARFASRQLRSQRRGFRSSPAAQAAHNFTMPALSPTMTEGNIASWKVKEGDEFQAGDVLLEVETDKAQMDVEAQDDGIVAKILTSDGAKGVKVGSRIAVFAEPGDDISSLEIPAEDSQTAAKVESGAPKEEQKASAEVSQQPKSTPKAPGAGQKQKYPLYPSVQVLLHTHNLNAEDIPPTGPNGRLLKGDVLAYLDRIPPSYPKEIADRISKLSHLDLSNVKPAAPKDAPKQAEVAPVEEKAEEIQVDVAVPVSLTAVMDVQRRIQESLGITLPLSTFLSRAIALANEDLPYTRKTPTADELFDAVLGLDKVYGKPSLTKDGSFEPQIVALPDPSLRVTRPAPSRPKKADLFDELIAPKQRKSTTTGRKTGPIGSIGTENIFSLSVGKEDEKRAKIFLERVKTVLEAEPGRLVL